MKWTLERENGVKVWQRGPYRVWCDRDPEYGMWAASITTFFPRNAAGNPVSATSEQIIGHANTRRGAQRLCAEHESGRTGHRSQGAGEKG